MSCITNMFGCIIYVLYLYVWSIIYVSHLYVWEYHKCLVFVCLGDIMILPNIQIQDINVFVQMFEEYHHLCLVFTRHMSWVYKYHLCLVFVCLGECIIYVLSQTLYVWKYHLCLVFLCLGVSYHLCLDTICMLQG